LVFALTFFIIIAVYTKPKIKFIFSKTAFKGLWLFAVKVFGLNLLERVALRLDYVLVRYFLGEVGMGIYFSLRGIVEGLLGFLVYPIQTVLFAYYSKMQQTDNKQLFFTINKVFRNSLIFVILIGFLLTSLDLSAFIQLLFGEKFISGNVLIGGLFLYFFSILWFENLKVFAVANNQGNKVIVARIIQVGVIVLLSTSFTYYWQLKGAGIATGLASLILPIYAHAALKKYLNRTAQSMPSASFN
jgi:O-antigen/teichoic acid export membrane protein